MAQVINTNVASLFAGAALNKSANALLTAQQRLSSGLRINSARDDSSGLAIATGYDTQIRSANVQIRNANDAISTAQTRDGYLGQITENLQRMSEILTATPGRQCGNRCACREKTSVFATLSGQHPLLPLLMLPLTLPPTLLPIWVWSALPAKGTVPPWQRKPPRLPSCRLPW